MDLNPNFNRCDESEVTCAYAAQALSPDEVAAAGAHIASCADCQRELESLGPVLDRFVVLACRCAASDHSRCRRGLRFASPRRPGRPPCCRRRRSWSEPEWEQVAPGIECKLLATDTERHRVSMLVRLAPGASYPAHTHAGVEELHLLDGELWIDERKLLPGDYNRGEPRGRSTSSVWSETGCTCRPGHQHRRSPALTLEHTRE